jgi:uncharacterized protein YacL
MTVELIVGLINLSLVTYLCVRNFTPSTKVSKKSKRVILDSCALIDGRIIDLAQAGFTPDTLVIPSFIIRELQTLADGSDSHKRERARFGLDVARELKELAHVHVEIDQSTYDGKTTDDMLVLLAQNSGALLYTTDFNLAKVAEVEGVKVLNVNELAQKLRPNVLPGEKLTVKIVQKGSNRGQGVGYAEDGTMVVVDQGYNRIGETMSVVVDRMHNTLAGKMIFAKAVQQKSRPALQSENRTPSKPRKPKHNSKPNDGSEFVSDLMSELR